MWIKPTSNFTVPATLKVFNSLTKSKTEFIPQNGKVLTWYSCGPTVYDSAHLGHARAYITFDIIRRILTDYFGFTINFVMNITDVDDKIILKARQQHLLKEAKQRLSNNSAETKTLLFDSLIFYIKKYFDITVTPEQASLTELTRVWDSSRAALAQKSFSDPEEEYKFRGKIATAQNCINILEGWAKNNESIDSIWQQIGDVVSSKLDHDLGDSVSDQKVFSDFAKFYENDFLQDMRDLNVEPPTVMTRVSEYIDEIVSLTQGIIDNGYAYESEGSVYFDVGAFHQHNGHVYAKLRPSASSEASVSTKLMEESEGSLGLKLSGKRSSRDFALWKCSKPGEPMWESPWGLGRPGWHIECSAMASSAIPGSIDIHSGGIDLCFPHHDNEMAQSEAFYNCQQWVNYFIHAGHLNIEGQKMSKSLKNFITIKQALKGYTGKQIRIMFLQHSWASLLDYKDASLKNAVAFESNVETFFTNVKAHLADESNHHSETARHNYGEMEKNLRIVFDQTVNSIHEFLTDSFDTPSVMNALSSLMGKVNIYIRQKGNETLNGALLKEIARFIFNLLKMFGVYRDSDILFSSNATDSETSSNQNEDEKLSLARAISEFRFKVRTMLAQGADKKELFRVCDELRDNDLFNMGIILEDRENIPSLVKLVDNVSLLRIREERDAAKNPEKSHSSNIASEKEAKKKEKSKIDPALMFKSNPLYSAFDEAGIPTHDSAGLEISKSQRKKLSKEYEIQLRLYNQHSQSSQ